MSDHAKLSPSKRHRWAACPGSIREEAKYPEPPSGPAAIDGTHSHTLLSACINAGLVSASTYVGVALTDEDGIFQVDADRARRVDVALDYLKSRIIELGDTYTLTTEEEVNPEWLLRQPSLYGHLDVQLTGGDVLEIIDYKDGMSPVDAVNNLQLEQYAYGALAKYQTHGAENYPFKWVRMTIIQPKLALKGMAPITSHTVTVQELLDKAHVIVGQALATAEPDAPLNPGEVQCKYCAAKGACSALAAQVGKELGLMFSPIQAVDQSAQLANRNPSEMDVEQLRQVLEAAPLVRQFIEGVEAEALRRMEAGQTLPGFKLVRGRGSRRWTLPDDEIADKLKKMGVPKTAVYTTSVISVAQAEKVEWVKRDGTKVSLSDRQLKTIEAEYVTNSTGKLTVAPESDSREAVIMNAAPMFAPVEPAALALPAWLS